MPSKHARPVEQCGSCGEFFANLPSHLGKNPWCKAEVGEGCALKKKKGAGRATSNRSSSKSDTAKAIFEHKLRTAIARSRIELHEDKFIAMAHCDHAYNQVFLWTDIIFANLKESIMEASDPLKAIQDVQDSTLGIMGEMVSWDQVRSTVSKSLQVQSLKPVSTFGGLNPCMIRVSDAKQRELAQLSISSLIVQLLQCDPYARQNIIAASELWKTGDLYCKAPTSYGDITDGRVFREHKALSGMAEEDEPGDSIRVALYIYNDDFTTVNPIGTKRGAHKYSVHMAAIANLPQACRFRTQYILPFLIAQSKLVQEVGLSRILCGANDKGEVVEHTSFASDMQDLAKGIPIQIPDDVNGGMM